MLQGTQGRPSYFHQHTCKQQRCVCVKPCNPKESCRAPEIDPHVNTSTPAAGRYVCQACQSRGELQQLSSGPVVENSTTQLHLALLCLWRKHLSVAAGVLMKDMKVYLEDPAGHLTWTCMFSSADLQQQMGASPKGGHAPGLAGSQQHTSTTERCAF